MLGGVFDGMGIDNVSVKDNKVELSLSGKSNTDGDGTVTFISDAGDVTLITVPVLSTVARVDGKSYRYEDGKLYFDIVLIDDEYDEFTDKADGNIKVDVKSAEIVKLSDDKKNATVAFATQAKDIDSALEEFRDKKVTVLADAVSVGMDCEANINVIDAYISAYATNADLYGNYVDIAFDLYINEGTASEITKYKIALDGDFSGNDITSVEKVSDTYYKINIRVDTSNGILVMNDGMIYGILSLADGSLMNTRGTKSDDTSCILYAVVSNGELLPFEFGDVLKKVQLVLDSAQLFGLPTGPVSKISEMFGEYADKADTLTSLAENCLGIAGIIDDCDDVDKILDAIKDLNDCIEQLGYDISNVEHMIRQCDIRMREAFDKQRYISYRDAWKSFTNGPMKEMTNIMDEFRIEYNNYLVTFMKNTGYSDSYTGDVNNGTLNVFLNTDNRGVELPSVGNEKFSLYYSETKLDKFVFSPGHMTQACKEENKGGYTDPIALILNDPEYKAALEKFNKKNNLSLTDKQMRTAFETQASAYAMSKIDPKKINTAYNNFMNALNEDDLMLGNTMNIYISMLSCFYNFQSEAGDNILYMQNFLIGYTIRVTSFASYASWFNPGYDRKSNPILTQYETAMKMLEKDYLHDTSRYVYTPGDPNKNVPSGYIRIYDYYDWSYAANDKVRVIMKSVEGDKYSGNKNCLVQSDTIQLMQKRYATIKESGRTTDETFGEYFINSGAVPSEYRDMINDQTYFATDVFSKDNDAKLEGGYTCTSKFYPDSYFCEKGQTYDVSGSFGYKGKASSKYINGRSSRYMNTYTLGNVESTEEIKISS